MPPPTFALALALAAPALAAGGGSIAGGVRTPDGTPLRGVRVEIAAPGTTALRRTYSDHHGRFLVTGLPPDAYRVTATAPGLTTLVTEDVQVTAAAATAVDLAMEIAVFMVRVRLVYKAPHISTTTANMKELYDIELICPGTPRTRDEIHYKVDAKQPGPAP